MEIRRLVRRQSKPTTKLVTRLSLACGLYEICQRVTSLLQSSRVLARGNYVMSLSIRVFPRRLCLLQDFSFLAPRTIRDERLRIFGPSSEEVLRVGFRDDCGELSSCSLTLTRDG